jgi:hypothetical protein
MVDVIYGRHDDISSHRWFSSFRATTRDAILCAFLEASIILVKDRISIIVKQNPREYYDRVESGQCSKIKKGCCRYSFNHV